MRHCVRVPRRAPGAVSPCLWSVLVAHPRPAARGPPFSAAPVRAIVRCSRLRLPELPHFLTRLAQLRRLRLVVALRGGEFTRQCGTACAFLVERLGDVLPCLLSALVAQPRPPAREQPYSAAPVRAIVRCSRLPPVTGHRSPRWPVGSRMAHSPKLLGVVHSPKIVASAARTLPSPAWPAQPSAFPPAQWLGSASGCCRSANNSVFRDSSPGSSVSRSKPR